MSKARSSFLRRGRRPAADLAESEARYRALIENATEAIVVLDVESKAFVEANQNAVRLFKLPLEKLLSVGPVELSPEFQPDGQPSAWSAAEKIEAAIAGGTPVFEWTHRTSAGTQIPCEVRLVRLPSANRILIRGCITDITERKRAQDERELVAIEREVGARAQRLQRVTDAALSHLTLDELLPELVKRLREVLEADNAAILLGDKDGNLVVRSSSGIERVGTRVPAGVGFAGRVARSQAPIELHGKDLQTEAIHTEVLRTLRALLGVPLVAEGRVVGVLHCGFRADRAFSQDDIALLGLAADRAALAIEHARVYEQQRAIAQALRESLLPEVLPDIPGLELAASYHPASGGIEVGGDFYDVFSVGESRWVFVIGDVCGKGPRAAVVTAQARYTLRAEALREPVPAQMLYRLNGALLAQPQGDRFLTLACGVLDISGKRPTLTLAVGGHPLPLVVRSDRSVCELGSYGMLLGIAADAQFAQTRIELFPGESIVFYTDGLLDAFAPQRFCDAGDVAHVLSTAQVTEASNLIKQLEVELLGKAADSPRDDVAILALGVRNSVDRSTGASPLVASRPASP
jgi:PAS domain S-box-containing protein